MSFPRRLHHVFPDRLRVVFTTKVTSNLITAVRSVVYGYNANSAYAVGPTVNNGGSFANNCPAGLSYLLSSNSNAAFSSAAPYFYGRIDRSECVATWSARQANNQQIALVVLPTDNLNQPLPTTATIFQTLLEQPRGKSKIGAVNNTAKPLTVRHVFDTHSIFGLNPMMTQGVEYWFSAGTYPQNPWYWNVTVGDPTQGDPIEGVLEMTIVQHCELFSLNNFSSVPPT